MITPEQRAERINYIGASESAAVLGMGSFGMTPLSVWAEKTGMITPKDLSKNTAVQRGNRLEPVIADEFEEKTGWKLETVPETIYHPKYKFIAANLDRRIVGTGEVVELKWAGIQQKDQWADGGAPKSYVIQVLHQLAVTGAPRGHLACMMGNEPLIHRIIERDDKAINNLIKRLVEFWTKFVVPKTMPGIFQADDKETLDKLFAQAVEEKTIPLNDNAAKIIELVAAASADYTSLGLQIDAWLNELRAMLGDAESGTTATHRVYWSNSSTRRMDMEKFKAEQAELYAKYCVEKKTRRFLIKEISNAKSVGRE